MARSSIDVSEHDKRLLLTTECPLPSPLPTLRWIWVLQRMDVDGVRDQFLVPLLASNILQSRRVEELSEMLTEKDKVMGKILDRLDSDGMDLTSIFPQAVDAKGNKGNKRLQLMRQLPALRPYNHQAFLDQPQTLTKDSRASREKLLNTALEDTSARAVNGWWMS